MKVVFVSSLGRESSTFLGRLLPLARELSKKGVIIKFFLLHYKYRLCSSKEIAEGKNVTSYYLGQAAVFKDEKSKHYFPFLKLISSLITSSFRIFKALLKEKDVDVIVVSKPHPHNFWPAILVAKVKRKKIILDSDDLEYASNKKIAPFQKFVLKFSEKIGIKFCDYIFVCSPFLLEYYKKLGFKKERIIFIPTGIGTSYEIEPEKDEKIIRKEFGIPGHVKILFYFGSLSISSGHRVDTLLESFKKVSEKIENTFLVIAGSGEDYFFLKEKAKSLKISERTRFLGRFKLKDIFPLIRICDLIIDPVDKTLKNQAKSSFRLTEAIRFRKPFISLNSGIQKYFNYGLLLESGTKDELFLGIERIITDDNLKEKITSIDYNKFRKITFAYLGEKVYGALKKLK